MRIQVHFAAAHHLVLADHGDFVFRLAGDHASVAAIAFVQVDGHRPLVAAVGKFRFALVKRQFFGGLRMLVGKIRILAILSSVPVASIWRPSMLK